MKRSRPFSYLLSHLSTLNVIRISVSVSRVSENMPREFDRASPLWTRNYFRVRFHHMVRSNYNERSPLKCTIAVASALHATVLVFYLADHAETDVYVFKSNSRNCGLLSARVFSTTHSDQTYILIQVSWARSSDAVDIKGKVKRRKKRNLKFEVEQTW